MHCASIRGKGRKKMTSMKNMTSERKSIVLGVWNAVRIFNKMWKFKESDVDLLVYFGKEDNVTSEEATEIVSMEKAA